MFSIIKRSPLAVTLAILLHLAIVLFLIFGMEWELFPKRVEPKVNVVQAHTVDAEQLRQKEAEEKARERKQLEQEAQKRKQAEEQKRKVAEEKKRKSELEAKQKAEAEAKRQAEVEAKRKAEAETKRKAEAEAKRKAEAEAKRKAEAEAKRQAEAEAKRKAEAEAKRKAEAEAKRKAEEAARLAAEQAERERALQEQLAAEQNAREIDRYVAVIKQQVGRNWLRTGLPGEDQLSCRLRVRLIPGGEVIPGSVSIVKSSGNAAFDRSVEAAVYKASPLPVPSGPLFESFRNLTLDFKPGK